MTSTAASATAGANVRAEMARKAMTQTTLARHLQFSQVALSARLRGVTAFTLDELVVCARVLGVSLDHLLAGVRVAEHRGADMPTTEAQVQTR